MKRRYAAFAPACAAVLLIAQTTQAATIASTSFENETPGGSHTDPATDGTALPAGTIVDTTNAGGGLVDSTGDSAAAGDLGFNASWKNTREDIGLSDGDFVGVTAFTGEVGAFFDGDQGYQINDPDGAYVIEFDSVDVSAATNVFVDAAYFINTSGWEPDDSLNIYVESDAGAFTIVDTTGLDINDLNAEGVWISAGTAIPDAATFVRLLVVGESNSGSENFYIDGVVIRGDLIPEPTTIALLAVGAAALVSLRRKLA